MIKFEIKSILICKWINSTITWVSFTSTNKTNSWSSRKIRFITWKNKKKLLQKSTWNYHVSSDLYVAVYWFECIEHRDNHVLAWTKRTKIKKMRATIESVANGWFRDKVLLLALTNSARTGQQDASFGEIVRHYFAFINHISWIFNTMAIQYTLW